MHILDLQKTLGLLLMPAGMLWLGLLALSLVCLRKRPRRLGYCLLACFGFYTLTGNCWVGQGLIASLEHRLPPGLPEQAQPFDAICVLGGGCEPDPSGEPQLNDFGDRIAAAARLWHSGRTRLLVASGSALDTLGEPQDLGAETRRLWLGMGVPAEVIQVIPEPCRITREEIAAIKRLQKENHWQSVGLLSSAWHLPRAMTLARRVGLEATPIGADRRGGAKSFQRNPWVPQARGFMLVQLACWEYLGRCVGR